MTSSYVNLKEERKKKERKKESRKERKMKESTAQQHSLERLDFNLSTHLLQQEQNNIHNNDNIRKVRLTPVEQEQSLLLISE